MITEMLLAMSKGTNAPVVKGESFEVFIQGEKFIFFIHVNEDGEGVLSHWASGLSINKADGATFEQCRVLLWEASMPSADEAIGRYMLKRLHDQYGEARLRSRLAGARVINHEPS